MLEIVQFNQNCVGVGGLLICMCVRIYVYVFVCVCVCIQGGARNVVPFYHPIKIVTS